MPVRRRIRGRSRRRAPGAARGNRSARRRDAARRAGPRRVLAVSAGRAHGDRQRRVSPGRLRPAQCDRRPPPARPRLQHARRWRQPRLRPRADRELRAGQRDRMARRLDARGRGGTRRARILRPAQRRAHEPAARCRFPAAHVRRQHCAVPADADPALLLVLLRAHARHHRHPDLRRHRAQCRVRGSVGARDLRARCLPARQHGRDPDRRLPRRAAPSIIIASPRPGSRSARR